MIMKFLIDTNLISKLARKTPYAGVTKFMIETPQLLVSPILFHELSYSLEIAETAGQLRGLKKNAGRILTVSDSMMAAMAIV